MMSDPLNVPVLPSDASSPAPGSEVSVTAAPGDHGPDVAPANVKDPSTFPRFPASQGPELALPGPHPHQADDIGKLAGTVANLPDPLEGFTDAEPVTHPAGVTQALPGPHPHQAADIRSLGGDVARWADPMDGFADDE